MKRKHKGNQGDQILDKWKAKFDLLNEHIAKCLLVGAKQPRVFAYWDEKKQDVVMEIRS
jgi:hypothetical protein